MVVVVRRYRWRAVAIQRNDFTVENCRAQIQASDSLAYGREFPFKWQVIARPNPRLASRVDHGNRPIAVQLGFEDPVRGVEGFLRNRKPSSELQIVAAPCVAYESL
jgi:hypothetical protein